MQLTVVTSFGQDLRSRCGTCFLHGERCAKIGAGVIFFSLGLIIGLFSLVPYLLVSWAYTAFVNGGSKQFFSAFGALIAVRLFFSFIETLGSILSWRVYGKNLMVEKFLRVLRENNFPKRECRHDDFSNYLARIESGSYPATTKSTAKEIYFVLSTFESMGILVGMRMHAASEEALEAYSPKAGAPILTANG